MIKPSLANAYFYKSHVVKFLFFLLMFVCSLYPQSLFTSEKKDAINMLLLDGKDSIAEGLSEKFMLELPAMKKDSVQLGNAKNDLLKYQKLFKQINQSVIISDSNAWNNIVNNADSIQTKFQQDLVGVCANTAYLRFRENLAREVFHDAMRYYILAQFFRIQFFANQEADLADSVKSIKKSISLKQYDFASDQINELLVRYQSNPAFFKFKGEIAGLKSEAGREIEKKQQFESVYSQTVQFNKQWMFSGGIGLSFIGDIRNSPWTFITESSPEKVFEGNYIQMIEALPGLSWQIDASYFVNQQLSICVRSSISTIYYTYAVVLATNFENEKQETKRTSASFYHFYNNHEATIQYYLQKETGLRVYVGGGIGDALMSRKQTKKPIGMFFWEYQGVPPQKVKYENFISKEESESATYWVLQLGTDYVDERSTYMVGAFLRENIFINQVHLVSKAATTIGVKGGVIF